MADPAKRLVAGYVPTIPLAVVGIALFGLLACIFWIRLWRQGSRFMLVLCISTTTMAIGFAIRIPEHSSPYSLGLYIGMTLFTLLSPCGFLAQDYVILPRLASHLNAEDCLFLSSRKIVRIFVWSDVITFWLQASGGGLTASQGENMRNIGHWVALVGLIAQAVSFGIFTLLTIVFGLRLKSKYPLRWSDPNGPRLGWTEDWRTVYYAVLWTAIGILIRSGYRIAEYAQGYDGTLRTTEAYFYALDSLPLFLAIAVWTVVWPPAYLHSHLAWWRAEPAVDPALSPDVELKASSYGLA